VTRRRKGAQREAPGLPAPPPRSRAPLVVGAAAILVLAAGVLTWQRQRPRAQAPARLNLLLVTLDTTRADRLGCYGYAAGRTRRLDQLAAEGVRFERAYATAPITLPSHASMLTGLYPFEHGVRNNGNFYLPDRFDSIATVLKRAGYHTAAFVSSFILDRRYGLARGFDTYDDHMEGVQRQVLALEAERRGDRTALALSRWLEAYAVKPDAPFFAWLHLYDPHEPYTPPPPFREVFASNPYDGEIAFDDAALASILDKLQALGLLGQTVVAVMGDHGESLGDHGEETHSMFVYESAVRVPFLLWRPGLLPSGRVVAEAVRGIDLAPTVLEILGVPPPALPHARSLLPLLQEIAPREGAPAVYTETYLPQFYMNWAPLRALVDERFKLIDAPRPELYDLRDDRAEVQNLFEAQPQRVQAMKAQLDQLTAGSAGAMNVGSLDADAIEKLTALGYLGAGATTSTPPSPAVDRKDPKDVIAIFNRLRRANSAVRDRRFDDALPILAAVLREDPDNAFARLVLGSAQMGRQRWREAIQEYRRYAKLVPTSSYAHQWMAICHLNLADRTSALREAEAALALDPRFTDARVLKAGVLAAEGRHADAIRELQGAVETDPGKPMVRLDLAKVLAEAGRPDDARRQFETILKDDPASAPALVGLGALEARQGALQDAVRDLARALEIDPGQDEARFNLARALEAQGQDAAARAEYRKLSASPSAAPALRAAARAKLQALTQ
jgi:arylsulfatase A-like enzyme/Tfp pilus assembly protein PilF